MTAFKAGIVQMRSGTQPENNIRAMEELVRAAADAGAHYVQTPEMTGALVRDKAVMRANLRDEASDPVVAAAARLSQDLRIHLHIGSTAILLDSGKVANRSFLFAPDGTLVVKYDKIHMFDVDLDNGESWRESATYEPGNQCVVADLPWARFGLAVCYDVRFPALFRDQALGGASVLTVPAAFTRQTGEAHWHVLLRARAIENGAFVISAAQGGVHEDGRETYGHSLIVSPWGKIIAEVDNDAPGFAIAEIDPEESAAARRKVPNLKNARAFDPTLTAAL